MKIVVLRYNAGNIQSVCFALQRLGYEGIVSDEPQVIQSADKVIFPGVGEASGAMAYLKAKGLDKVITQLQQPVLGICLGMQLLCQYSEEGNIPCLGIFDVKVERFSAGTLKVPQVGWNTLFGMRSELFSGLNEATYQYFVHGYYVPDTPLAVAKTNYGRTYASALQHNNFYGVQFHPEKSGKAGEVILNNFLKL